jgi:hypothetical protein
VYNTKAVGGTNSTATHNCLYHLAEYQSYDIKRARDRPSVVLFLFARKSLLPTCFCFEKRLKLFNLLLIIINNYRHKGRFVL